MFGRRKETNPKAVSYSQFETNTGYHNMRELIAILIVFYCAGSPGGNVPDFGRIFCKLKYTHITQSPYTRCWTVTEIIAVWISSMNIQQYWSTY